MNVEIVTVTPQLAEEWLATNTDHNRSISKTTVNRYAQDMIRGQWLLTGEAIKFDTNGRLIDGQHRLGAVIASKKTVQMAVVRGLDPETMLVIDTGRSRSGGDALKIVGQNGHSNALAALTRKIIAYEAGKNNILGSGGLKIKDASITNKEIVDYCTQNDLMEHIRFGYKVGKSQFVKTLSVPEYSFLHWFFSKRDSAAAEEFLEKLSALAGLPEDHPIYALAKRLNQGKYSLGGKERLYAAITAWNAWRNGEKLVYLRLSHVEDLDAMPEPI